MSFIESEHLERAFANLDRIRQALAEYKCDAEGFIATHFNRLRDWDFPLFSGVNVKIQDKEGRGIALLFNRVQRQLWRWFLEDMVAGKPVRWFIIKGRQQGCSTWILALFYWLTGLRPNRNALIVSQDDDSVANFNSRLRSIHAEANPLLKSETVIENRDIIHFGNKTTQRKRGAGAGLDSRIVFATAGKGELGRSFTFHAALLSEFCIWPEIGIDINEQLTALNQAIPELPGTVIILESTAKGENASKGVWDDKSNGYKKIFISWVADEAYRTPVEVIDNLCGTEEIGGKQTRYGDENAESKLIREQLAIWYPEHEGEEEWIEAEIRARLQWRRNTIDRKCMGSKSAFRQEYPTCVAHAFSSTSKNCFDLNSLELMQKAVEEEGLPAIRFNYIHDPEVSDPGRKFQIGQYGPLTVYRRPDPWATYVIGGDASQGIANSGDPSALIVLQCPDLEEVASYSGIITPDKFAEMAYYLGIRYNKALLAIEDNEKGGYAANLILHRTLHYPRLYYRFDPYDRKAAGKPGFNTRDNNKSVMVTELTRLIYEHEILIRTPEIIEQLAHYMLLKNGTMGGASGWHDDLVSALLITAHLANKVHLYPVYEDPAPKGSFAWHAKRYAMRRQAGSLGYK